MGRATIAVSIITWWMFTAWLLTKVDKGLGYRHHTLTQPYFKLCIHVLNVSFFVHFNERSERIYIILGFVPSVYSWHPFLMTATFFVFLTPSGIEPLILLTISRSAMFIHRECFHFFSCLKS